MSARGYRPIADYAAIGDCHGSALVASDGGVDWCALGRFDAEPACCRLLDAARGGHLSLALDEARPAGRAYLEDTNILRTELAARHGRVRLTDFLPVGRVAGAAANDYASLAAPGWLVRRIEALDGELACDVRFAAGGFTAGAPPDAVLHTDVAGRLVPGRRYYAVLAPARAAVEPAALDRLEAITAAFWREWISYCRYRGPHAGLVRRSALALKLMTYAPTGAAVAAFTTSLPETLGGSRNWDYRASWVRDTSLMLEALAALGYSGEAQRFLACLRRQLAQPMEKLQVVYGIGMEEKLDERSMDHLDGYAGSRPVRAGNDAWRQRQSDLYGYIAEALLTFRALGGRLAEADRQALARMVDFIAVCWPEPDRGLWEMRGGLRHFVHSKAMCWVVLDRAMRLCGARDDWLELRRRMQRDLLARGSAGGHYVQAYGDPPQQVDASLLRLAMIGLPDDALIAKRTREAVEGELRRGDFVDRYHSADGLPGDEGAFVACSFWLVEALAAEGRVDEAGELFARLAARANDVGLYSEEMDAGSGAFLGNFPQAFTHLALVGAAVNLELARRHGPRALRGAFADRARRAVGATIGWRGALAALTRRGRMRLRSSRASQLA